MDTNLGPVLLFRYTEEKVSGSTSTIPQTLWELSRNDGGGFGEESCETEVDECVVVSHILIVTRILCTDDGLCEVVCVESDELTDLGLRIAEILAVLG